MIISSDTFVNQAISSVYDGIKYSQLDCQAFVERVLADAGCRKPDGSKYNWKGSNSMWRNALSWKGTLDECKAKFGLIPPGAWVFVWANDGGEKERGYDDDEGNAKHVGIYVGGTQTRDSTKTSSRDGVGYRPLSQGWNRVGLCKYIDYDISGGDDSGLRDRLLSSVRATQKLLDEMEGLLINANF